jgi:hypothetical protein
VADEVEKQKPVPVDINDLSLADQELEVDENVDAFAGPPPPDDGDHLVKLSIGKRGVQQKKSKDGRDYYVMSIVGTVIDPKFEGRLLFDDMNGSTLVRNGTCGVVGILKALGETVPSRTTSLALMRLLKDRLAGEPQVVVTSRWEAYCSDDGKTVKRGQRNFKQNDQGSFQHMIECENCGAMVTANARVTAYKPAASA